MTTHVFRIVAKFTFHPNKAPMVAARSPNQQPTAPAVPTNQPAVSKAILRVV